MRLLRLHDNDQLTLSDNLIHDLPPYEILSHTWGPDGEEVTFQDLTEKRGTQKPGYQKILFCGRQAKRDGLDYFWVDTCCIDKSNHTELSRAINSMFRWYQTAVHCYVYLSDVSTGSSEPLNPLGIQLQRSRWFTRGWTLQELLAPVSVKFFSAERDFLGDKMEMVDELHDITKIKVSALRGTSLAQFSVHERMNWSRRRQTTEPEDIVYCLLGIFDVFIPLIYGEGEANAMNRLQEAIDRRKDVRKSPTLPMTRNSQLIVPFGQNEDFIGREPILVELVGRILPDARKNDCQRTVLEGLGGVGKTQIALEAAYRILDMDPDCSIFWVPAITLVTFENAYRGIGEALNMSGTDDEKADIKALVKVALEKFLTNWLLIIDNLDDIGLLASGGLQDYLPFSRKGSILFTTRNHEVVVRLNMSTKNAYIINEMDEVEAVRLLKGGLKDRQLRDVQATKDLVRYLTYLPLAIKQASAYMARTGETTVTYLQYCLTSDESQIKLLNTEFEDRWRYSGNTNPITTTWLISFQHLAQSYPLAVDYLKFVCFLSEKDIPISLLPPGQDGRAENEAIGILEGYAFITVREQGDSFDMHRLVRLATRNWTKAKWKGYYTEVVQHLTEVYPFPEHESRQIWIRYMSHAETALLEQDQCINVKAKARLLYMLAESYTNLAKYKKAEQIYRQTLELYKSELGPKHPSTLGTVNNLAIVLNEQGKYEDAEKMHRQALELMHSVLGPKHPSTLSNISNLAVVLGHQGKYEEAEEMHRQVLKLQKSVLGLEHPSALGTMNNLAIVLGHQGKYEEAEQMHRQVLELKLSVLGPEHSSTLDSMNNLGTAFRCQGKYEEAEKMYRQALKLTTSILGLRHPSTFSNMNNLAVVLRHQGKYEEAEKMYRQVLELKKSVLGLEHPSALGTMNNLAVVLDLQGNYEEAEQIHRQVLDLKISVLGPEHPLTLDSMNNLAVVLGHQRNYEEAEQMYRHALERKISVLGPEHPSTDQTRKCLQEFLYSRDESLEATSDDSDIEGGAAL